MTSDLAHLPTHSDEKLERQPPSHQPRPWLRTYLLPIPGVPNRRLRIFLPNISIFNRLRRKRGPLFIAIVCIAFFLTVLLIAKPNARPRWSPNEPSKPQMPEGWNPPVEGSVPTLIFPRKQLQELWKWEIASGHYPSRAEIPEEIRFLETPVNPAVPPGSKPGKYRERKGYVVDTHGTGPKRVYLDIQSQPPNVAYPPRPVPGSIADMDEILRHCNYDTRQYVRDCLEVLRVGGGLDNGQRYRRENLDDWKYIYVEQPLNASDVIEPPPPPKLRPVTEDISKGPDAGLFRRMDMDEWEKPLTFSETRKYRPAATLEQACDPENPRIFHMFWTGPFTDKPFLALMSFLYTQNTGLHLKEWPKDSKVCRPQFWLWISPPPAEVNSSTPVQDMFAALKKNPWSAPFLHPRFKDVIHFKPWNTTEQLDAIPEIRDEWRTIKLGNSGGQIVEAKSKETVTTTMADGKVVTTVKKDEDEIMAVEKSPDSYDRLSVVISDLARFALCHRYGGIYLDADTIFLRDWEELWGWKGAFAYRWSRLPDYNTAVLRMNRDSAVGKFLFRTALRNGLDFHPMTVTRYMQDAHARGLLLRLPDALFDAAWLNTEDFQLDRPPQPFFTKFEHFFESPKESGAAPQALGFNGFFRGSYSYHFHNFWWRPFDPERNWPDLGPRFANTEKIAHDALEKALAAKKAAAAAKAATQIAGGQTTVEEDDVRRTAGGDKRDLDWSAVMKRTFEAYIRGETPNMYGEWFDWLE